MDECMLLPAKLHPEGLNSNPLKMRFSAIFLFLTGFTILFGYKIYTHSFVNRLLSCPQKTIMGLCKNPQVILLKQWTYTFWDLFGVKTYKSHYDVHYFRKWEILFGVALNIALNSIHFSNY